MKIEYSSKAKKFIVHCSFAENHMISVLPNKRWQKRTKVWHVSVLSRSAEYLLSHFRKAMTEEAIQVAEESMNRVKVRRVPFPGWYPYKTEPFNHQRRALDHAWGLPYDFFSMEMGTGKTKTAIDLHSARFMEGSIDAWVVFCPLAVVYNWVGELKLHSPIPDLQVYVVHDLTDAKAQKIEQSFRQGPKVFVMGIESLQQGYQKGRGYNQLLTFLAKSGRYAALVDECHLVKNPDANRSKNIEFFCENATFRLAMTGSPIAQGILDLYQEFRVLDPNIIGMDDYYSFRNRYAEMGGYENREVVGYKNVEELMSIIKPFVFQCTKAEALDLPEKMYSVRHVRMADQQDKAYKEIHKECETIIKDAIKKGGATKIEVDTVLAKYTLLQQITGGFLRYKQLDDDGELVSRETAVLVEPSKNPKIKELLEVVSTNPGKKVIIWARFRQEIAMIVEELERVYPGSTTQYHGGFDVEERKEQLRSFKEDDNKLFFVSNQQTGGTGLTINESSLVVYFSNSLQLVHRMQSEDRNHRIGQKNPVLYVDLVCEGTVDVDAMESLKNKRDVADYVRERMSTDPGRQPLTGVSPVPPGGSIPFAGAASP